MCFLSSSRQTTRPSVRFAAINPDLIVLICQAPNGTDFGHQFVWNAEVPWGRIKMRVEFSAGRRMATALGAYLMVPQGDPSFPKQVALLFPAAVFHAHASTNRSIRSSDSLSVGYLSFD